MADMHTPLKPCPFCGGEPKIAGLNPHLFVRCRGCGCEGPVFQTMPDEAIAAWNRRAPSQDAETVKALRAEAIEEVLSLLTGHELYRYRPKAFDGFIEYARTTLAGSAS